MTPTRWQEIQRVYHAALERPPTTRDEFLMEVCKNDSELRHEVESLLAHDSSKTDKLDQPPWVGLGGLTALDATVTVMNPGTRLGPYRIEGPLGKGGMGEVFRAVDTRLGRPVAVKVCANQFDGRFEREARAISTLNHPHICTLYDVGPNYLIMELVEGETLAATLNKGPLPMELILRYGVQIADALAAAHAQGITHRDLKPANIMVTKSGVKVLDFGLAKITRPDDAPKQSETLTASHAVMGTLSYMAPEQLEGKACDARTDIFALGLLLYEMAMGKKAFTGDSQAALIAEVMRCRPAPMESVPEKFRHVVERSLARDPEERWQTAKDVKAELLWAGKEQAVAPVTTPRRILPRWIWGFAAGIAALGLGLGWTITHFRQPAAEVRTLRLTVNPPAGTEFLIDSGAAISPDGHLVAFVATSPGGVKLWVRPLDSLAAHELPGTDDATFPFWSPDSRSLGFFAGGKLKRVEVAGGLPTVICDVASGRGGSWNEQGIILFNAVNDGPLLRVSSAGGMPVPFTTIDAARGENSHRWPQFLPGGRRFLYWVRGGGAGVYLGSMDRPQEKIRVLTSPTNAVYAPDRDKESGHLFWVRDGSLMAQAFDPEKGQLVGAAVPLAEAVAFGDGTRLAAVSVANNGTLLYSGESAHYQLATYARDGKPLGFLAQPGPYLDLRISPDGQRLALSEIDGRASQIWQMEFARGIPSRVTFGVGAGNPVWSPDSQRLAYAQGAPPNLFSKNANGTGSEESLLESRDTLISEDWSPDGRFVLYLAQSNDPSLRTQPDLWLLPLAGDRKPFPFLTTPFVEGASQFSPDGKWIAYSSNESSRREVYVQSFPATSFKWQVSSKGGDWVRWRKDGKELYYIAPDRKVMSVAVRTVSDSLEFGTPSPLFAIPVTSANVGAAYTYDVMPDGQRFLALAPAAEAEAMTVILNWQAESSPDRK